MTKWKPQWGCPVAAAQDKCLQWLDGAIERRQAGDLETSGADAVELAAGLGQLRRSALIGAWAIARARRTRTAHDAEYH